MKLMTEKLFRTATFLALLCGLVGGCARVESFPMTWTIEDDDIRLEFVDYPGHGLYVKAPELRDYLETEAKEGVATVRFATRRFATCVFQQDIVQVNELSNFSADRVWSIGNDAPDPFGWCG